MNFRQKKSHYEYHPLPRDSTEPDEFETMKLLPLSSRERMSKLYDDGTLKTGDLDHKSIITLQQLTEPLQLKVIEYLQTERLFLANSRSKAGFLVSACDRAKKGELDARGFGALDPWRAGLIAECMPKVAINLIPEDDYVQRQDNPSLNLTIAQDDALFGVRVSFSDSFSIIKDSVYGRLVSPNFTRSRLKLVHPVYGSVRDDRTPGYYNLTEGETLTVKVKARGGRRVNRQ
jgi:hypothetical protein